MKVILKMGLAAGLTFAAAGLAASSASAMPMNGLDPAVATTTDLAQNNVENVRWACGPWGCRWVPGYGYGYGYGYRRHWGGYGYRGGYRRGWGGYHHRRW